MIYTVLKTNKFKKNIKRYEYDVRLNEELKKIINFLTESGTVPRFYRPHKLSGKFILSMECHVRPDLLLIYTSFGDGNVIYLNDIGSHNQIFG
jgi:mRNA interferase YafQ